MELNLDFTQKLRTVFDVCDEGKEGYISVEHFASLARDHFGASDDEGGGQDVDLAPIIKALDPHHSGHINFDDFCHGVRQIMDIKAGGSPSTPRDFLEHPNPRSSSVRSTESEEFLNSEMQEISEISVNTFQEYDMNTDEDTLPSNLLDPGLHSPNIPSNVSEDDRDSAISGPSSELQDSRRDQEVSDEEEKFEDFGESEGEHQTPEVAEKAKQRKMKSPGSKQKKGHLSCNTRRISSAVYANHLLHRPASSNQGSRRSSFSEDVMDDIDENFHEINDKVKNLEEKIQLLTENQVNTADKHGRLKEENVALIERVHSLEEQLREMETKSRQALHEEYRKHRDNMARHEREKQDQIDTLTSRLQHIEREYKSLKEEAPRLKSEIDRCRTEKEKAEDRLSECQDRLASMTMEHQKLHETLLYERGEHERERILHAQTTVEMTTELEDLRRNKRDGRRLSGCADVSGRVQELESHIQKLQKDKKSLAETNEELNAMLLCKSVEEGRSLLRQPDGMSLAAEMEEYSKDENLCSPSCESAKVVKILMTALQEQQEVNVKLREYVDRIILTIMESNPSILEIKTGKT